MVREIPQNEAIRREAVSSRTACATYEIAGIPWCTGIPKRSVSQMQPVSTSSVAPLAPYWLPAIPHVALGLASLSNLSVSRADSLLLGPRRGPGVAQGHLLKIVLARTRNKTLELADGERVRLLEWAYANGLRLGGEQRG